MTSFVCWEGGHQCLILHDMVSSFKMFINMLELFHLWLPQVPIEVAKMGNDKAN